MIEKILVCLIAGIGAGFGTGLAGMSAAAVLIMVVPNLLLFIIMQSKVMSTVATSGIK